MDVLGRNNGGLGEGCGGGFVVLQCYLLDSGVEDIGFVVGKVFCLY